MRFNLFDFLLHVDKYISLMINSFGLFSYVIIFIIIFCETGLVLAPFLPGDSLLFVCGAFAARGSFNIYALFFIFLLAAVLGDSFNYFIGDYFGENIFLKFKLIKKENLERTKLFFKKHGGKTVLLARFVPIVRTFAPFVSGVGKMHYKKFLFYNVLGGFLWVCLFLLSGYFFGSIPWVEKNMTFLIIAIVVISLIPVVIEYVKRKR